MNLYLLESDMGKEPDMYHSLIVAAPNEEVARHIHPLYSIDPWPLSDGGCSWCAPSQVRVFLIGRALPSIKAGAIVISDEPSCLTYRDIEELNSQGVYPPLFPETRMTISNHIESIGEISYQNDEQSFAPGSVSWVNLNPGNFILVRPPDEEEIESSPLGNFLQTGPPLQECLTDRLWIVQEEEE